MRNVFQRWTIVRFCLAIGLLAPFCGGASISKIAVTRSAQAGFLLAHSLMPSQG